VTQQSNSNACSRNLHGYQEFWETVPVEVLQQWKGKSVALQPADDGWRIIDGADDLIKLRDSLLASGVDVESVVIDRVPSDEEAAEEFLGGVQLR
jgi:hypothetical protein